MRIEILETIKHERDTFTAGETRVVDDSLGGYFCRAGWAKDLEGNVETAPRDPHRVVTLDVDNAAHATTAGEANG